MRPLHPYGGTDRSWEVKPPTLKLRAPMPPEPTHGINIWKDTMERHKWLQEVIVHCDAWLMKISGFTTSYMAATEHYFINSLLHICLMNNVFLISYYVMNTIIGGNSV
jgi:hypothetical protein